MIRSIPSVRPHVQIHDSVETWKHASDSFERCSIQNMCARFATVHVHAVVSECDMPSPRFSLASQLPLASCFIEPAGPDLEFGAPSGQHILNQIALASKAFTSFGQPGKSSQIPPQKESIMITISLRKSHGLPPPISGSSRLELQFDSYGCRGDVDWNQGLQPRCQGACDFHPVASWVW